MKKVGEVRRLPGPKTRKELQIHRQYSAKTTVDYASALVLSTMGEGCRIWDVDGNEYLDCYSGVGANTLGHRAPEIISALVLQLCRGLGMTDANLHPNTLNVALVQKLAQIAPGSFPKKVFLCNSGTEAVEAAKKICKSARPERQKFIAFYGAFHGRTEGALSFMGSGEERIAFFRPVNDTYFFPHLSSCSWAERLEEGVNFYLPTQEVNAVILELIQGEGGVNIAPKEAVEDLVAICRKQNWLLIIDEVQTGIGRTGKMFACEHYGLEPDIVTLAKGLSFGQVPIGAVVFKKELDWSKLGRHSNTFGGNPLACAAALAGLERVQAPGFLEEVLEKGRYFLAELRNTIKDFNKKTFPRHFVAEARGLGLMLGIEFRDEMHYPKIPLPEFRDLVCKEALRRGLILVRAGNPRVNPVLRFLPPLVISRKEITTAVEIFEKALDAALRRYSS
jgi:4-aminobutyrate aminotransferase